jgi:CubicO group peptidase (beta-lactamase class C family)
MARPKTAADLRIMEGSPPAQERLVTLANWQDPPFNRWAFQHVRELIPTARIPPGTARRLPWAERDLSDVVIPVDRRRLRFERWVEETFTDALVVLHRGRLVHERYLNGMTPDRPHLLMSVSKSITAVVVGILVGRGWLSPDDLVTEHVPELAGSSFDGCTVRHLLDMRAGTRFDEDYDNPDADVRLYEQVYLWRPKVDERLPPDACSYFATLPNDGEHGGSFRYRSVLTDVLAWVTERAGGARLAELIARELWGPMGAEFDAEITVDRNGNPMADGGICATPRDLARFGQVVLDGGRRGRRRIVPQAWIRDTVQGGPDSLEAFVASPDASDLPRGGFYRNQWWVVDPTGPIVAGLGVNGQTLLVHGPARAVVAKVSTWPEAWSSELHGSQLAGCLAICEALADHGSGGVR